MPATDYEARYKFQNISASAPVITKTSKVALQAANYLYHTDPEEVKRDVNALTTGISKAWGWARDKYSEYERQ